MDVADIILELDEYGFEDTSEARKVEMINKAIQDICSREPWPFLQKKAVNPTVDANGKVTGITDLRSVLTIIDTTSGQVLQPQRWDEFTQGRTLNLTDTGDPYIYYFLGDDLYVWPIPNNDTLQVNYVKAVTVVAADDLEADIVIPARYHELIILGCLYRLYLMEDDAELSAGHRADFDAKLLSFRQEAFVRQFDRPDHIFVIDDDLDLWE